MSIRIASGAMAALVGFVTSATAQSPSSGTVDFVIGSVTATGPVSDPRALAKGDAIRPGETIVTGSEGRAQLRFPDGAYLSLQPNSELRIVRYRFDGEPGDAALFALRRGVVRTVSGRLVGAGLDNYRIETPAAMVAATGRGGTVEVRPDRTTVVTCTTGTWSLSNLAGSLHVPAGTSAQAGGDGTAPPRPSIEQASAPPAQPAPREEAVFVAGDARTRSGFNSLPAARATGYTAATAEESVISVMKVSATFDAAGGLTSFVQDPLPAPAQPRTSTLAGSNVDSGSDGVLTWGRWIGSVTTTFQTATTVTFNPFQGLHYVVGAPTPSGALPSGGTFTYNLIGGTRPAFADGQSAPGALNSAVLAGDFTRGSVDVNLVATATGGTFVGTVTAMPIERTSGVAAFSSSSSPAVTTAGGTACSGGCGFGMTGFFAGPAASHAGVAYSFGVVQNGQIRQLIGTAALAR